MTESTHATWPPTPVNDTKPIVVEQSYYYVVQRAHYMADGTVVWIDYSNKYHAGNEEQSLNARLAAMDQRDRSRAIFGKDQIRVARRDTLVTEHGIEG